MNWITSCLPLIVVTIGLMNCSKSDQPEIPEIPDDCLVSASPINGQTIPDEYIITLRANPADENNKEQISTRTLQLLSLYSKASLPVKILTDGDQPCLVARLDRAAAEQLAHDPAVLDIEPDRRMGICASCVTLVSPRTVSWSVRKTGYGRAGQATNRTVWIIDTGVDLDHPDLNIDTERSRSFIAGQTTADDLNGHGTHVAGIIGARNNAVGILGIASETRMVALKVLDQLGEGLLSSVINAVRYVNANGRAGDVVNMSLGGEGISPALEREIQAAANRGILFAIAAGNEAKDADAYSPARVNHPNVLTVSAVDSFERFAPFSNFGSDVDVAAYGVRVVSTYSNGRYAILSGTSMAAPHVAGLLLTRGIRIPKRGTAQNDPDGMPDPIARE